MTSSRFDRLTRSLGARSSRRAALTGAAAGLGSLALHASARPAAAQQATPAATPHPDIDPTFLFVQTFTSGTLTPDAGQPDRFLLTLTDAPASTIAFADRPARLTDSLPTEDLPRQLSFDPANPPNAALLTRTDAGDEVVLVVELLNPTYESASRTVTYGARELADYSGIGAGLAAAAQPLADAPSAFGVTSLFIDSGSGCQGSLGLCGSDSDCCTGYVCVSCTITPDSRDRTPVSSYDQSMCMPGYA